MDTALATLVQHTTQIGGQSYLLGKIISAWERIQEAKSGRFRAIIWNLGLLVFWWYSQAPATLPGDLKWVGWYLLSTLVYRKREFSLRTPGREMMTGREFAQIESGEMVRGLPIYVTATADKVTVISARYLHTPLERQMEARAEIEHLASLSPVAQFSQWNGSKYELQTPTVLYPSPNFERLKEIIRNHTLATQHLRNFNIVGILIDGEPGLGKSMAIHHLANSNVVRRLYRADLSLVECLKTPMDRLFRSIYHQIAISEPTVFLFDEIDKWLSYQEQDGYRQLLSKPQPKDTVEERPTFEDYSRTFRTEFLYALLGILERFGQTGVGIVIFCSNNFDSIFGDLDMTHFRSLKDRFQRLTFHRYSATDIADYLRYNNQRFLGSELHVPNLESILVQIPDCSITARKLNEITILHGYRPAEIVAAITDFNSEVEPSIASSSSPSSYRQAFVSISSAIDVGGYIPGKGARDENGKLGPRQWCSNCEGSKYFPCGCSKCDEVSSKSFMCHWCKIRSEPPEYKITEYIPKCHNLAREFRVRLSTDDHDRERIAIEFLNFLEPDNVLGSYNLDAVGNISFHTAVGEIFWTALPATDEYIQRVCFLYWKWYKISVDARAEMKKLKDAASQQTSI